VSSGKDLLTKLDEVTLDDTLPLFDTDMP